MIEDLSRLMRKLAVIGEQAASNDIENVLKEIFAAGKCTNSGGWKCLDGFPYISHHGAGDTIIFGDSQVGGSLGRQFRGERYLSNSSTVSDWIGWMDEGFGKRLNGASKIYVILGGNGAEPGEAATLFEKIRLTSPSSDVVWVTPAPPAEGYRPDRISDRLDSNDNIVDDLSRFDDVKVVDSHGVVRDHYKGKSWSCPSDSCDGIHLKGDVAVVLGDEAKSRNE